MDDLFRIPVGKWAETALDWIIANLGAFFDGVKAFFAEFYNGLDWVLSTPPFWAIIVVLAALAFWLKGWKLSLGTIIGFLLI